MKMLIAMPYATYVACRPSLLMMDDFYYAITLRRFMFSFAMHRYRHGRCR